MNPLFLKLIKTYYIYALFVLATLVTSYLAIDVVVKERLEDVQAQIQLQISEQETLLATIAETTARNGADEVTEAVVRDCSVTERTEFDTLLGRLDGGLSIPELTKLERLFGRCGSFFAERKAVMIARLTREIEVYEARISQLRTISNNDSELLSQYNVMGWRALAEQEKKQSDLFTQLVSQQDKIITTLLSGKTAQSEEIKTILNEVKQNQEALFLANKQASELRTTLVPL